jgi:hypothetical protein
MKRLIILVFVILIGSCINRLRVVTAPVGLEMQVSSKLDSVIFHKWYHSYEEDKGNGILNFRRENFPFPEARNRRCYEFRSTGKFFYYTLGPTDRPIKQEGIWIYAGKDSTMEINYHYIHIDLKEIEGKKKHPDDFTFKLVKLQKDLMQIKLEKPNPENSKM